VDSSSNVGEPIVLLKLPAAQEMARQSLKQLIALTQMHDHIPWRPGMNPNKRTVELAQTFRVTFTLAQYELEDCRQEIGDSQKAMLIWLILNKVILDLRYAYWANAMMIYYKTLDVNPSRVVSSLEIRTSFVAKIQEALTNMLQPKIYRMPKNPAFLRVCDRLIPEISIETERSAQRFAEISNVADPIINWLEHYGLDIY
jgi:hypothetical protein